MDFEKDMEQISLFCRLHSKLKNQNNIRNSEMGLLIYIERNYSIKPIQAAEYFGIQKSAVTAMVTSLTEQGYLEKSLNDNDRRSYLISLTKKGKNIVQSTYTEYHRLVVLLSEKLGLRKYEAFMELMNEANIILKEE